jgi:hypothetical protein
MKLAEALVERKAAQEKIGELNERLQRVILVQEGEQPAEQPAVLLQELDEVGQRLAVLIGAINRTNIQAQLPDGRTIMEAIAQRDVARMQLGVFDALIRSAGSPQFRTRGSEIKFVVTLDVAQTQRERDRLSKRYRELDTAIQAVNWSTDLLE